MENKLTKKLNPLSLALPLTEQGNKIMSINDDYCKVLQKEVQKEAQKEIIKLTNEIEELTNEIEKLTNIRDNYKDKLITELEEAKDKINKLEKDNQAIKDINCQAQQEIEELTKELVESQIVRESYKDNYENKLITELEEAKDKINKLEKDKRKIKGILKLMHRYL